MAITGNTQLGVTKQDIISALVQKELIASAVLAPTVMNVSQFATPGAQSVSFPKAGSFTVENRVSGAASVAQTLAFAKDTMALDQRATVSWLIDSMDALQAAPDIEGEYAKRAATAHAKFVDAQIVGALTAAAAPVAAAAGDVSQAGILAMRAALLKQNADRNKLALAISPDQEAKMLAIETFVRADYYGQAVIPNGVIGKIYGMPVFISNNIAGTDYFVYDGDGVALGFQRSAQIGERPAPEYGVGSLLKVMDQLFGVKALQLGQAGVASDKSALIVRNTVS